MFDKKSILKRLPLSLIILAASIVGIYAVSELNLEPSVPLLLFFFILLFFGLFYIIFGLIGAGAICLNFFILYLPEEIRGLGLIVLYSSFIVLGLTASHLHKKKLKKLILEENKGVNEREASIEAERIDAAMDDKIQLAETGEKISLENGELYLVKLKPRGWLYRILMKNNELLFRFEGKSPLKEYGEGTLRLQPRDEILSSERSFALSANSIKKVRMKYSKRKIRHQTGRRQLLIDIETNDDTYRFGDSGLLKGADIADYFENMGFVVEADPFDDDSEEAETVELTEEFIKFKKTVELLTTAATLAGMWMFLYPKPYSLVLLINSLLPAAGLYCYARYNDWINLGERRTNKPDISSVIIIPTAVMAIIGLLVLVKLSEKTDIWRVPFVQNIVLVTAISGTAVTLLIFLATKGCKSTLSIRIATVILSYAYAFGVTFGMITLIGVNP